MTFNPAQVVGLTALQRKVYASALRLLARRGKAPVFADIRADLPADRPDHIRSAVKRLIHKGHVRCLRDGVSFLAVDPPHVRVIREVCETYKITIDDLRGPEKTWRMQRIRRQLATRLRREHNYAFPAIGFLLDRYRSTVEVFCNPEQRRRRSQRRVAIYRAAAAARRNCKLSPDEVRMIRASEQTGRELAKLTGVSHETIRQARNGITWAGVD